MTQEEMAVKLAEVDARSKSNGHRLDEMSVRVDTLQRLTTAVEVMAKEQQHQTKTMSDIQANVAELGDKVDAIEREPAARWSGLMEKTMSEIKSSVTALGDKVDAIEKKPAKRWDGMVEKIIYGIVGSLVSALGVGILYLLTVAA